VNTSPKLALSIEEIIGAIVGFCGSAITMLDPQEIDDGLGPSFLGDLAAFMSTIAVVAELLVIAWLVKKSGWMLFVYTFPVFLVAAILLSFATAAFEREFPDSILSLSRYTLFWKLTAQFRPCLESTWNADPMVGIFGWGTDERIKVAAYLGISGNLLLYG
jgi:hypothetical protein